MGTGGVQKETWWKDLMERDHLEDMAVDGRVEGNIKIDFKEVGWGGMDWIALAQDWNSWRALVIAVMNFRVT